MRADLHIHSVYSDGMLTPDEICDIAKQNGVELLSVTDHDNLGNVAEKRKAAEKHGLKFVVGWEISSYEGAKKIHILGYGCNENQIYFDFLRETFYYGELRARDMIQKGNEHLGANVTFEDVLKERIKEDAPIHSSHVVRAFSKATDRPVKELYKKYFNSGKPAYSEIGKPTPEYAIGLIHKLGGIAVLAHPARITMKFEEKEQLINRLILRGLDGIECDYPTHTDEEREYFGRIAKEHGLYRTGGSDFHQLDGEREIGSPIFEPEKKLLDVLL